MKDNQTSARSKDSDDFNEERSLSSRQRARSQLSAEVDAFLSRGGAIDEVAPEVTADPPRKPQPKYGSRPI